MTFPEPLPLIIYHTQYQFSSASCRQNTTLPPWRLPFQHVAALRAAAIRCRITTKALPTPRTCPHALRLALVPFARLVAQTHLRLPAGTCSEDCFSRACAGCLNLRCAISIILLPVAAFHARFSCAHCRGGKRGATRANSRTTWIPAWRRTVGRDQGILCTMYLTFFALPSTSPLPPWCVMSTLPTLCQCPSDLLDHTCLSLLLIRMGLVTGAREAGWEKQHRAKGQPLQEQRLNEQLFFKPHRQAGTPGLTCCKEVGESSGSQLEARLIREGEIGDGGGGEWEGGEEFLS